MNLRKALRLDRPNVVAFVGAGGKTTSIFRLARELPHPVVVTTTTHMGIWQVEHGDRWIVGLPDTDQIKQMSTGVTVITGEPDEAGKVRSLSKIQLDYLHDVTKENGWSLLIEADGARQLPLKAPGVGEPVIPEWVDHVVVVAGLTGLGMPCDNAYIHRAGQFCELAGAQLGERVRENHLIAVLNSKFGGLKCIPLAARKVALLNQADDDQLKVSALRIAERLIPAFDAAVIGQLANNDSEKEVAFVREHIAGIILAAGGSSRFGSPKLESTWRGKNFIDNILATIGYAGLSQALVIINNAHSHNINNANFFNIAFLKNDRWQEGQSSSIRLGVQSLPPTVGGAVFFLGDQPHIPASLVRELVNRHACTHAAIVAPLVDGRRGNPVLFDRCTFEDLQKLEGDVGGRALFAKYQVEYVPWHDASILLDVDTPEDYARLLELE